MRKTNPLKPKTKEEIENFKKKYAVESKEELVDWYCAPWSTISRGWAYQFGAKRLTRRKDSDKELEELEKEIKYIPYPDFKITPFIPAKINRDPEDIGIIFADRHMGKITKSYNPDICKKRTENLLDSVMSIINLHRPIRKAHIFAVGDNVQGENVYQGSKIDSTKMNVRQQIIEEARLQCQFIVSLSQGVEEVNYYGVAGNHGRYDKTAPDNTNWDLFLYDKIQDSLQNQNNINIQYTDNFFALVNIKGFRFFLIHGHQLKGNSGVPLIAARRKMSEWYAFAGTFNYAYMGHFHTHASDMVNTFADYTICPPLVTGDHWAVETIGRASSPQQICFGIHEKYGRSFQYILHTDEEYLPKKYLDDPENVII